MAKQKMLDKVISEHYLSEDVWKKVELSQKEFDQLYKELTLERKQNLLIHLLLLYVLEKTTRRSSKNKNCWY